GTNRRLITALGMAAWQPPRASRSLQSRPRMTLRIELSEKLVPVLSPPLGTFRYRVLRGGRGSGKSFSVAKMSAIWGAIQPIRILCTREFQNSIKQSFYAEVVSAIQSDAWLQT